MTTRRGFFASLAALVVAPSVPVAPAKAAYSFHANYAEIAATNQRMLEQLVTLRASLARRAIHLDDLQSYLNRITAEHHAKLNAFTHRQ